jgi:hypothetical protein
VVLIYVVRDESGAQYLTRAENAVHAIVTVNDTRRRSAGEGKYWEAVKAWEWTGSIAAIKWQQ